MNPRPNLLSPEVVSNPYPLYTELLERAPVCQVEPMGMWAVSRYADCLTVLKDPQRFSSAKMEQTTPPWFPFRHSMVVMDPPNHTKFRGLVSRAFGGAELSRLEPFIRRSATELASRVVNQRTVDFVTDFAMPLPSLIMANLLGLDSSLHTRFKMWSDDVISVYIAPPHSERMERIKQSCAEISGYLRQVIEVRRSKPQDDMVTDLIRAEVDGRALTDDELLSFLGTLLIGGLETTVTLLTNTLLTLSSRPEILARVRAQPSLIPQLVDEVLRFEPPVHGIARVVTTDVELSGVTVPSGSVVFALVGAAGRDPRQFPAPERFDIDRKNHGTLPFGHGPHFCLGTGLARMEARIALEELLSRISSYTRLESGPVEWSSLMVVHGPARLPLSFTPA